MWLDVCMCVCVCSVWVGIFVYQGIDRTVPIVPREESTRHRENNRDIYTSAIPTIILPKD